MRLLTGLTLGKKIALLASASLLVGVGIFSFVAIRAVRQSVDTMLDDRLTLAQLTADYINDKLANIMAEVSAAAVHLDGSQREPGSAVGQLDAVAARLAVKVVNVWEVGGDGVVRWSKLPLGAVNGFEFSIYPTVRETLVNGTASVSGLVPVPGTGIPVVLVSAPGPADAAGGPVALVVAVDVAQSSIAWLVRPVRLGATGYVEILDQNGIVVARTEPGPEPVAFEVSDHSGRFADLIVAGAPTRGVCHSCHEPGFVVQRRDVLAFAPLSVAKWGVGVRQSESEAFTPIRELRQNLLLAGLGMLVIVAMFMILTTRDVVGRIQLLTAASRRIARGDLVTAIAPVGEDELGVLAGTLDEMRIKLRSSYGELEQRTNELSALLEVSEILSMVPSSADLETALDEALDRTLATTRADAVAVFLRDEEKGAFVCRAHRGLSAEYATAASYRPGEGLVGEVARTGEAISVPDISADPRTPPPDPAVAEGLKGFAGVPVRSKHSVLGVLSVATRVVHEFSPHDLRMLDGIGGQIATALENVRLNQEIQRRDELRRELLREVLAMQEEDRRRIARELHDETSQVIASLTANLEAIAGVLPKDAEKAEKLVRKTQALSVTILDEIQRLIYELRPSLLDDMGLVSAARWLAENNLEAGGVAVEFKTVGKARRLSSAVEVTLFRVIQEAMNNITRHAGAKKARVTLYFKKLSIMVRVSDDGLGFDVEEAINTRDRPRGLGLLGMRERVELLNGTVGITSVPGGGGTVVEVKIPIEEGQDGQDQDTAG
jgi:signal transduction histidine kinase